MADMETEATYLLESINAQIMAELALWIVDPETAHDIRHEAIEILEEIDAC